MTDRQLQAKLNQLRKLANELDAEAKRRYGQQAGLFFEADGAFHIMSGDCDSYKRQEFIEFSSDGYCTMGAGAW